MDVLYLSTVVPFYAYCVEDGAMDKQQFLQTWKEIPQANEVQYVIDAISLTSDQISEKLQKNNVFTIAKRNVDVQDMLYQSMKLTNGIWILAELKVQPGVPTVTLSLKSLALDVAGGVHEMFEAILRN